MKNSSKITTSLEADAPFAQRANYRFDQNDRQYIDSQIVGMEDHLVQALIRARHATYVRVNANSASLKAGDGVCMSSLDTQEPEVTKCTSVALTNAVAVFGIAIRDAAPGSYALIAIGGTLPRDITGLAQGNYGYVHINTSTGRPVRVTSLSVAQYGIGVVDNAGSMVVIPGIVTASEGGAGGDFTAAGDLDGDNTTQEVIGLLSRPFNGTPVEGNVPTYNGDLNRWDFRTPATGGTSFTAAHDLSGSSSSQTVVGILGHPINGTPSDDNVPAYNASLTRWEWRARVTGGGGTATPSVGISSQFNVANGVGAWDPVSVYGSGEFIGIGIDATSGVNLMFQYGVGTKALLGIKDSVNVTRGLVYFSGGAPGTVTLGEYGVFNTEITGIATDIHGGGQVTTSIAGVVKHYFTHDSSQSALPRLGFNEPYASEGEAFTTSAAAPTYPLAIAEYNQFSCKILNDSAGTYIFPFKPNYYQTYVKWVENNGSGVKTISNGGAFTYTLPSGARRLLKFSPEGVFGLDIGTGSPSLGIAGTVDYSDGAGGWGASSIYVSGASLSFDTGAAPAGNLRFPYPTGLTVLAAIRDSGGTTRGLWYFDGPNNIMHSGEYGAIDSYFSGKNVVLNASGNAYISANGVTKVQIDASRLISANPVHIGALGSVFAGTGSVRLPSNPGDIIAVKNASSGNRVALRTVAEDTLQLGSNSDPFVTTSVYGTGVARLYSGNTAIVFGGSTATMFTGSSTQITCRDQSGADADIALGAPRRGLNGFPYASEGMSLFTVPGTIPGGSSPMIVANCDRIWKFATSGTWDVTVNLPANVASSYEKTVWLTNGAHVTFRHANDHITLVGVYNAGDVGSSGTTHQTFILSVTPNNIFVCGYQL